MLEEYCIETLMASNIVHYKVTAYVSSESEALSSFINALRRGEHVALLKLEGVDPFPLPIAEL
jgi:hypothetical protein